MTATTRRIPTLILAGTMAAGAGLAVSAPSAAAADTYPTGVVTASRLSVREVPSTDSTSYGTFAKGKKLTLLCKVTGQSVGGNSTWYQLPGEGAIYVSGRYIATKTSVPQCTGTGVVKATLTADQWMRRAPSTSDAKVRVAKKGAVLTLRCGVSKGLTGKWFYTSDRTWVSGANLKGASLVTKPGECLRH